MRSTPIGYLLGAAAVATSHTAGAVAGFFSLWLLARILSKEMLGGYAFASAVVALVSLIATLGLDRSLLLRIAPLPERSDCLHGGGLAARVTILTALAGSLLALGLALSAAPFVSHGALPEAEFWFPALSVAVVPMVTTMMLQVWYQANHRVPISAAMPGIADLLRSLLFAVVFVTGLGALGVAAAATLAAAAPAVILIYHAWRRTRASPRHFGHGDLASGLQFLVLRLSNQGMRHIDLLMMGLLATGAGTAEYAVAARLASVTDYGRAALIQSFSPRVRRWLSSGGFTAAFREYDNVRCVSLAVALSVSAGFVLIGRPLLQLLGHFEAAYTPLLLLAASYIVTAGFGMHSSYLAMAEEVGWSALMRVVALAIFVGLNLALIPHFGAAGAALATFTTQGFINTAGAALTNHFTGLQVVDSTVALIIILATVAVGLAAFEKAPPYFCAAVLALALALLAVRSRHVLMDVANFCGKRLKSGR